MKSALNGVLQFSISDGWVGEVDWSDKGWVLPELDINQQLYDIIEREIVPAFYTHSKQGIPEQWIARMRKTMETEKAFRQRVCVGQLKAKRKFCRDFCFTTKTIRNLKTE